MQHRATRVRGAVKWLYATVADAFDVFITRTTVSSEKGAVGLTVSSALMEKGRDLTPIDTLTLLLLMSRGERGKFEIPRG